MSVQIAIFVPACRRHFKTIYTVWNNIFSIKDTNLAVEKFVGGTAAVDVCRNSVTARVNHVFSCQENRSLIFSIIFNQVLIRGGNL